MYITHDGDRVSRYDWNEQRCLPWAANLESVADDRIDSLIEASACGPGSPGWERAQLRYRSGFYGASIPELDRMVDLVKPLPQVLGAGLMGAGGGGCILILARAGEEAMSRVIEVLEQSYYRPLGKPVTIEPWRPTAAAGELVFDGRNIYSLARMTDLGFVNVSIGKEGEGSLEHAGRPHAE